MQYLQVTVFVAICVGLMFGIAALLSYKHQDKRAACIKAGYTWSPTKYVCTVNP